MYLCSFRLTTMAIVTITSRTCPLSDTRKVHVGCKILRIIGMVCRHVRNLDIPRDERFRTFLVDYGHSEKYVP